MQAEEFTTVSDYLDKCYKQGFLGTMYDLQGQGIPLCFPMDQEAMVRAVQLDSKISKGLYTRLGEDVDLLKRKITAQVSRGIATGMSYKQVAQQLAGYTNIGYNNAVRIARTEGHRIQVQAGMDACYKAKDKGADVVKQWDSTLDARTRDSHARVDGEIRELDEKFSNGLRFPSDPHGQASEVINCRCALLQRARWALDDEELEYLKKKADFYGLDKNDSFEEFKTKYLKAAKNEPAKKQYLTEKKLKELIADGDVQLEQLKKDFADALEYDSYDDFYKDYKSLSDAKTQAMLFGDPDEVLKLDKQIKAAKVIQTKIDDLQLQMDEWQTKLDKKVNAKEIKKLKKEQVLLQKDLDAFDLDEKFGGIWYGQDDITLDDWKLKQSSIQKKIDYYDDHIKNAAKYGHSQDDIDKFTELLAKTKDFDKKGQAYWDVKDKLNANKVNLTKLQKSGKISKIDDAFTQERKDAAYWFTNKNGSVQGADGVLRDKCGEVWNAATQDERNAIYEYTMSYSKFNEPLRGIEYGTNKFLGVGNVDLDMIGVNGYGGYKKGEVKKLIDDMASIIDKSSYDHDMWVQRGCRLDGMDSFFGISKADFNLSEADLNALLVGTEPTEYAFGSCGVAKGKGLNTSGGVVLNIYAPKGTKMMYAEPFSHYGAELHDYSAKSKGLNWNGKDKQTSFGNEAEIIMQKGTKFRVTKVTKSNGTIYVDLDVIEQGVN